ncbi:MAG: DNA topoisomerase IB [Lysobacterales bacterium]
MNSRKLSAPASVNAAEAQADASAAGLVYVSDRDPGISRLSQGQTFRYQSPVGKTVRDATTLARIRSLAVPPAYANVWICLRANGHLQATGHDARGRKQYRYHPNWSATRGLGKFGRVIAFGEALPRLRRRLRRDLALQGFPRDKVLAIVVAVMMETLIRVGNTSYARSNRSYGLTTLRNQHVRFMKGGRAQLKFRGKGGIEHDIALDDARLVKLMRSVQQLPGQSLFQYLDDNGHAQPVGSSQINEYLREAMGDAFTAKDFRTWGGTLAAFQKFAAIPLLAVMIEESGVSESVRSEAQLNSLQKAVIDDVARGLGNTPAICRKAYIDPAIFAGWRDGSLQKIAAGARGVRQWELAALKFLRAARRSSIAKRARSSQSRSRTVLG